MIGIIKAVIKFEDIDMTDELSQYLQGGEYETINQGTTKETS